MSVESRDGDGDEDGEGDVDEDEYWDEDIDRV